MPKTLAVGDTVKFHLIAAHVCGQTPEAACRCAEIASDVHTARIVAIHPLEEGESQPALVLDVKLPKEIAALGYAMRQSHAPAAVGSPPASGSWTA